MVRHLSEDDIECLLTESDDEEVSKLITFVKRLYKGTTLEDAADYVGKSASTGSHWSGLVLLTPNLGAVAPEVRLG
jgi:hypothetical protein